MSEIPAHKPEGDGTIEAGKAGVSDAETLAAEPGQSVAKPADRVMHPGTSSPRCARVVWIAEGRTLPRCTVHEPGPCPATEPTTSPAATERPGGGA